MVQGTFSDNPMPAIPPAMLSPEATEATCRKRVVKGLELGGVSSRRKGKTGRPAWTMLPPSEEIL